MSGSILPMRRRLALVGAVVALNGCGVSCTEPKASGNVVWRVPSVDVFPGLPYSPAANSARTSLYFPTADFRLKKIRADDGALLWDVSTGSQTNIYPGWNAVVSANVVAISKVDVLAYDTTSGAFKWQYRPTDGEATGMMALTADDSTIFAAGYTGRLHAINALTGTARWVADLRKGHVQVSAFNPTLKGGIVFVCTKDFDVNPTVGTLWALDVADGSTKWSYTFQPKIAGRGSACYGSAAFYDDMVIEPQADGRVYAFTRLTGQVRWTAPPVHDESGSTEDERYPAVAGNIVIVTSNAVVGRVVAYNAATGTELWRRSGFPWAFYPPAVDESSVFLDYATFFIALETQTGATRWQTSANSLFRAQPILASSRIYVGGRDGSYAVKR